MWLSVVWLEGVLDYFNSPFPHGTEDRRKIGFGIGQQFVGLYLAEMLLKYALDGLNQTYDNSHSLRDLFGKLPLPIRTSAESKYAEMLSGSVSETWDFASSVESFLDYLGDDPATDSRYFWERSRTHGISILFSPGNLRLLVHALFVALHNYPERGQYEERYDTRFISFEDSIRKREENRSSDSPRQDTRRSGKRINAHIFWLEGLLEYLKMPFPHEAGDPRILGFQVGQRIVGLYLIEMLLKYALDDQGNQFGRNHNLYSLFKGLPRRLRRAVEKKYKDFLGNHVSMTWDFAESVESLLQFSGDNPLTDTRYFWEQGNNTIMPLAPHTLVPLIYALFIELHNYPQGDPVKKRYETEFLSLEQSLRTNTEVGLNQVSQVRKLQLNYGSQN